MNPVDINRAIFLYWNYFEPSTENEQRLEEIRSFSDMISLGVVDHKDAIDEKIQSSSKNWKLSRMAMVDRNILRMAVFELLYLTDIPKRVSINEAIELGKRFGSEDSGSFINGVLDKISQSIDKE